MTRNDTSTSINNIPRLDIRQFPLTVTVDKTLQEMLPEQDQENKTIQGAKELLGNEYSTEEIKEIITSFEYLINNWTEEYEKKVFNNKTLKELLKSI